jgi:hypothetical protein
MLFSQLLAPINKQGLTQIEKSVPVKTIHGTTMNISQSLGMKPSNELIDLNSVVFKFDSKSVAIQVFGLKKMVVGK